jgi:hypothetical protein
MAWLGNVGMLCWIVAALLAATIQLVGPGAWGLAPGHYYAKFSGTFYRADEFFNRAGKRQPLGLNKDRFSAEQLFVYLEYGVAERLTVIGRTKIGREVVQNSLLKRTTTGIGDVEVAGQYQWLDKPLAIAVWIGFKLPTGYDPQFEPPLGTGDPDMEAKLLAGRAFSPWAFYLGAEAGYRWRGGRFSNQINYLWNIGVTPRD